MSSNIQSKHCGRFLLFNILFFLSSSLCSPIAKVITNSSLWIPFDLRGNCSMKKIYSVFKTLELIMIVHIQRERERLFVFSFFGWLSFHSVKHTVEYYSNDTNKLNDSPPFTWIEQEAHTFIHSNGGRSTAYTPYYYTINWIKRMNACKCVFVCVRERMNETEGPRDRNKGPDRSDSKR